MNPNNKEKSNNNTIKKNQGNIVANNQLKNNIIGSTVANNQQFISKASLKRQYSATPIEILGIINTIKNNNEFLKSTIFRNLCNYYLDIPDIINIDVKDSGAYINLFFKSVGMTLVFVCHSTAINPKTKNSYDNRIHCKVIDNNTQQVIGYSGVYIDGNSFMFKPPGPRYEEVQENNLYFFCIFNAINELYGQQQGGKKNIKNNLKTNTVLELKNICKNYKIKNYSKLNKDGLISLIKKTKKNLNK